MIRFPVRVDGSGGKQGGVQYCRDLDYDPITKTYNKTLNNAELLRDGFVVATSSAVLSVQFLVAAFDGVVGATSGGDL